MNCRWTIWRDETAMKLISQEMENANVHLLENF
jgi:hypothetical protein